MLRRTKNFLNAYGVEYEKEHVNPLMVPEKVYVLKFGKKDGKFLNRFIRQTPGSRAVSAAAAWV